MTVAEKQEAERRRNAIRARAELLIVRNRDKRWRLAPNYNAELSLVIGLLRDRSKSGKDGWKLARLAETITPVSPDPKLVEIPAFNESASSQ